MGKEKVTISGAGAIGIRVAEEIHKLSPETNLTILEIDKDMMLMMLRNARRT